MYILELYIYLIIYLSHFLPSCQRDVHWRVYRGGLIRVGWGIKEGKGSRRVGRAVEARELSHSLLISYSLAFIPNFPFNLFLFGRLVIYSFHGVQG